MIVRIHTGMRVEENRTRVDGTAYAPFISLALPGGLWGKVYAGNGGTLTELRALAASLADMAKEARWVDLVGLKLDKKTGEFLGYLADVFVDKAEQADIDWARELDREVDRAQVRSLAIAKAERVGQAPVHAQAAPAAAAGGAASALVPARAKAPVAVSSEPLSAEDLFG